MQDTRDRVINHGMTEDNVTKSIERYTAAIPSSAYLAVAVGAMGVSLLAQVSGRGKWGNFLAQWVPTWLLLGLYNKVVKTEGHDAQDRGQDRPLTGNSGLSMDQERRGQTYAAPRGQGSSA